MPREDTQKAEYMARRALGLLLTRPRLSDVGYNIAFEPRSGKAQTPYQRPTFRPLLHLLSSWLALRGLFDGVIPFLEDRYNWVRVPSTQDEAPPSPRGKIDWPATIDRFASGQPGTVLQARERVREKESSLYFALVLSEAAVHTRELLVRFQSPRMQIAEPLTGMLDDARSWLRKLEELLRSDRFEKFTPPQAVLHQIRELYAAELNGVHEGEMFRAYRRRSRNIVDPGATRQFALNETTQRLSSWRDQYLSGEVWLSEKAGMDLVVGRLDGLYELWCFAEVLSQLREIGMRRISQNSFLRRGSSFELGPDYYAYYDFGSHSFKNVSSQRLFPHRTTPSPALPEAALPKARVEWLLRDVDDFRNSVLIDTKYYSKGFNSGEALKVLGYMQNFGVRHGAVIFEGSLRALARTAEPVAEDIFRLPCPGESRSTLWVLRLVPDPRVEPRNSSVLKRFLTEVLAPRV